MKWAGPCLGEHDHPFIWTLLKVCTTSKRNDSSTPRNELGRDRGCWGARPSHQLECFYMAAEHQYKQNLQHREQNWAVFGGPRSSHKFECFWKASYHPNEKVLQHREMTWAVIGGARPAVRLNVVECLHNIKTKRFFNAGNWAGPWQGMLGSAAQPWTWMFLHGCKITIKIFSIHTVKRAGPCLGEHGQAISSNVFEKLHTIQRKRFFNTVKCYGSCLGEHERPLIWTLLNVCITSKQNDSSTPETELGRDRGCWGARPSHELECFYMAAEHPDK